MRYAFNSWCYSSFPSWLPCYPLEEAIQRLAAIGYDGIEIGCAAPHAWPDYLDKDARQRIRGALESAGIDCVSMLPAPGGGPGANPASMLAKEREWIWHHYKQVVDLAHDIGCPRVLYIGGWQGFGVSRSEAWDWSVECLKDVAGHAEERGVTICVEPTSADSNLIETPDHALELMAASGASNVDVMFDTFHALYRNEDPADYVLQMKDHLGHVHMSDFDRKAPGSAGMDFRPVMQRLVEIGFVGTVTMEIGFTDRAVHPDSTARQALEHLKSIEASL